MGGAPGAAIHVSIRHARPFFFNGSILQTIHFFLHSDPLLSQLIENGPTAELPGSVDNGVRECKSFAMKQRKFTSNFLIEIATVKLTLLRKYKSSARSLGCPCSFPLNFQPIMLMAVHALFFVWERRGCLIPSFEPPVICFWPGRAGFPDGVPGWSVGVSMLSARLRSSLQQLE